jgi:sporulation integral membrane protein YtvI
VETKRNRRVTALLIVAVTLAAVYLFVTYALRWLAPFIAAFLISRLAEPLVTLLTAKLRLRRSVASAISVVLVFALAVTLFTLCVGRVIYELTALARDIPALLTRASVSLSNVNNTLRGIIADAPIEIREYLTLALDGLGARSADLLTGLSRKILTFVSNTAIAAPRALVFLFTCAVATFFISAGSREISAFFTRQVPRGRRAAFTELKSDMRGALGSWAKAQLMLSVVTFLQLFALFLLLRVEFAVLLALIVAVIDMLPVLGVGTVLIPWAGIALLGGDPTRAVWLVVGFAVILIVRNVLEPRLVGAQLGLHPLAALMAMYIGYCTTGVIGMILFPIALIVLKRLNEKGILRLWK